MLFQIKQIKILTGVVFEVLIFCQSSGLFLSSFSIHIYQKRQNIYDETS